MRFFALSLLALVAADCNQDCKEICCRNGGGEACVHACGCETCDDIPTLKANDCSTYRKVVDGTCAEACLGSMVGICPIGLVIKAGGLETKKCADDGFTQDQGELDQAAGPCGTIKFEKYTKPVELFSNELFGQGNCNEDCKEICCRNGGGEACVHACGCETCDDVPQLVV